MTSHAREPSRFPVRGTIGLVGTVGALAVLLSFRGSPAPIQASGQAGTDEARAIDELIGGTSEAIIERSGASGGPVTDDPVTDDPVSDGPVTLTGDSVGTRWGDVQVSVTVDGSDIIDVQAVALPGSDRRSASLSDRVEATLREEAIAGDSADVSVVSGATYTSRAYAASLQSALDQLAPADIGRTAAADEAEEVTAQDPATPIDPPPAVADDGAVTLTGEAIDIRWGTVQVAVTISGDDILDVVALDLPDGRGRSARISRGAEPILREEAIAGDSADVSVVSGATYTSRAYAASLQSALDQLG